MINFNWRARWVTGWNGANDCCFEKINLSDWIPIRGEWQRGRYKEQIDKKLHCINIYGNFD